MDWDRLLFNGARLLLTYPWESHMRTRAGPRAEAVAPAAAVEENPPSVPQPGNPQYGPIGKVTPSQKVDWEEALRETKEELPLDHPALLEEARRAGESPAEMQLIIADLKYKEKRERLLRHYIREEEATPAGRRELERERREEEREQREEVEENPPSAPQPLTSGGVETAGTQETIAWQRRQIAKELYNLQKNLATEGLINGKSCDCIADKHCLGLEALSEETMAMHQDPIYREMLDWNKDVAAKGTPEAIVSGEYREDYHRMAQEARAFRKRLLGTADTGAMMTEQERQEILNRAKTIAREKVDGLIERELEVKSGSD